MTQTRFESFFSDLFNSSKIIDARLQVFLRMLIVTLTAENTDGAFTALIASLTTAYTSYFGNFETKYVTIAERIGKTRSLDIESKLFADTVRRKYSTIEAVYAIGSAVYLEFFPYGLSEISNLTRTNIQAISHRFATKATEYKTTLGGQPFADIFTGLETGITTALGAQDVKKANVHNITTDLIVSRQPVEDQLMKAMFTVGAKFWPNQAVCRSYFDFSVLYGKNNSQSVVESGVVPSMSSTLCIGTGIDPSAIFTLKNKSDFPVTFFAAHVVDGVEVGVPIDLPPHSKHVSTFAEFKAQDMLFLYVKNGTPYSGNWEVRMD